MQMPSRSFVDAADMESQVLLIMLLLERMRLQYRVCFAPCASRTHQPPIWGLPRAAGVSKRHCAAPERLPLLETRIFGHGLGRQDTACARHARPAVLSFDMGLLVDGSLPLFGRAEAHSGDSSAFLPIRSNCQPRALLDLSLARPRATGSLQLQRRPTLGPTTPAAQS